MHFNEQSCGGGALSGGPRSDDAAADEASTLQPTSCDVGAATVLSEVCYTVTTLTYIGNICYQPECEQLTDALLWCSLA